MKKEFLKKGFKDIFGTAAKTALKQCIWVIPTLGVLSLIQAKAYELEAEENEEASPTEEEQTKDEAPVEEQNEEVSEVSETSADENLKVLEKELKVE